MFKNVLIALSVLLNVCFLFLVFWGGGVVEKFSFIVANGFDADDELQLKEGQSFEDQFGVSKWVLENTANSIGACSMDFRCMEMMQFVYHNGLVGSLAEYQGDVYACKAKRDEGELPSPFTVLVTEKAEDPFQCVKMTKKYKGLSLDAIQSDSEGLEGVEKVKFE